MIQTIIGLTPKDDDGNLVFSYRINEMHPSEDFLCKRRSVVGERDGIKFVKTTFSVKIQLKKPIYQRYPFMIFECGSRIEVMEFEHNNLQCKPNLVFHKSVYEKGISTNISRFATPLMRFSICL